MDLQKYFLWMSRDELVDDKSLSKAISQKTMKYGIREWRACIFNGICLYSKPFAAYEDKV